MSKVFNYRQFYLDLDSARKRRGIAWNRVATRAGMTTSALHTFVKQFEVEGSPRKELSLENVVKLLDWLNTTNISPYVADESDDAVLPPN